MSLDINNYTNSAINNESTHFNARDIIINNRLSRHAFKFTQETSQLPNQSQRLPTKKTPKE